jgi:hypothetical protein
LRIDRQKLAAKAQELDKTIKQLTAMRDGLEHAVNCRRRVTWSAQNFSGSCVPPRRGPSA